MSAVWQLLIFAAAWLLIGLVLGMWIGRVIRSRDEQNPRN